MAGQFWWGWLRTIVYSTIVYSFHPKDIWKFDLDNLDNNSARNFQWWFKPGMIKFGWKLPVFYRVTSYDLVHLLPIKRIETLFWPKWRGNASKKAGKLFTLGNCHSYDKFRDIAIFMFQVLYSHVFVFCHCLPVEFRPGVDTAKKRPEMDVSGPQDLPITFFREKPPNSKFQSTCLWNVPKLINCAGFAIYLWKLGSNKCLFFEKNWMMLLVSKVWVTDGSFFWPSILPRPEQESVSHRPNASRKAFGHLLSLALSEALESRKVFWAWQFSMMCWKWKCFT